MSSNILISFRWTCTPHIAKLEQLKFDNSILNLWDAIINLHFRKNAKHRFIVFHEVEQTVISYSENINGWILIITEMNTTHHPHKNVNIELIKWVNLI